MKMMNERSCGILIYRFNGDNLEVLLGKCGGPKWKDKSVRAWNIPKGHNNEGENDLLCAIREFNEETGLCIPFPSSCDEIIDLGESTTASNKVVKIYGMEHDFCPGEYKVEIRSNMVKTEWPPNSGNMMFVPELSDAYYFKLDVAKRMIFPYQKCFVERLFSEINKSK